MNIRQLETFFWIARLGTFSAAAERLATSQANVSARIRELENELDVLLFDRIGRQVQLTLKGRELLVHAERVVADAAQLRLAAGRPDMVHGVVKVGLGEAVATSSLVAIINELKRRFPSLDVEYDIDLNAHLVRKLLRGAIDIGIFGGPVEEPELKFVPIGAMRLAWVGTPAFFAGRQSVRPADLATLPIISLPREARLFAHMQEWFIEGATAPASVSYCNNMATMLHVARAGLCVCIVPTALAAGDVEAGALLAPAPIPSLAPLKLFIATRSESVDPAVAEIASIMVDVTRLPPLIESVEPEGNAELPKRLRGLASKRRMPG
jgi:DNA-binding transcriptional LysR family regulator